MGSLTGSFEAVTSANNFNLSSPAQTDWIQFPQDAVNVNRKLGGGSTFSLPTLVGTGSQVIVGFSGLGVPTLTWTDGTPTASATIDEGINNNPSTPTPGQGLQFTVPADTNSRQLQIIWGSYSGVVKLTATLSDGSAAALTQNPTSPGADNIGYVHSTLTYQANSSGQTLTVALTLVTVQGTGGSNVWLDGAWYKTTASGLTLALTGNAATGARGSITPTRAKTLTGTAATGSVGSTAKGLSLAPAGNAGTASAGAVGSIATATALAGSAGTASAGAVGSMATATALAGDAGIASAGSIAQSLTLALTGFAASGASGSVVAVVGKFVALSGAGASASAGSIGVSAASAITGNAGNASAGSVAPSSGLDGVASAGSAGLVAPTYALAASAASAASGDAGQLATSRALDALAVEGVASAGLIVAIRARALTGEAATGSIGDADLASDLILGSNTASGKTGIVIPSESETITLTGVAASGLAGSVAPGQALSGVEGTATAGRVTPTQALRGNRASGAIGILRPGGTSFIVLSGNASIGAAGGLGTAQLPSGVAFSGRRPQMWDRLVIGPQMAIFGEPVTYLPATGGAFPVTGAFTDAYLRHELFADGTTGVTEVSAILGVQLSQFAAAPMQNDQIYVPRVNATYFVREAPRIDGRGAAKLMLSAVNSASQGIPTMWNDLVITPQMAIFGEPVIYIPLAGSAFPIVAVFTDAFLREAEFEDSTVGVTEVSAILGVQLSQFPSPPLQNDKAVIPSVGMTYVVREAPRVDSRGAAKLMLSLLSRP